MSNSSYAPVLRDDDDHPNIPSAGDLGQNLVGPPAGQAVPAATSIPLMQVVAPATLPEGYEFMAALGDRTVKVVVPPGGVEQGQKFEVPFPQHLETALTGVSVPVGHWRDGILDIFHYGVCHPACWTSSACHLLAAGQVISRLKLTWWGRPGTTAQAAMAFKIIFVAVVSYWVIFELLGFVLESTNPNNGRSPYAPKIQPGTTWFEFAYLQLAMRFLSWIGTTVVLINVRTYVREKYAIPASDISGLEDCCCSCWCPCLVASQMLRHTTDYDVYPATCCTETGIPPHAPSIV